MTEKEAVKRAMSNCLPYPGSVEYRVAKAAVESAIKTAKEHGAKFDHEMVELPELAISGNYGFVVSRPRDDRLTKEQACEVLRRCELVSKLRAYIVSLGLSQAGVSCYHLLKWLDGMLPVPVPEASTDQKPTYDSGWVEDPDGERSFRITSRP